MVKVKKLPQRDLLLVHMCSVFFSPDASGLYFWGLSSTLPIDQAVDNKATYCLGQTLHRCFWLLIASSFVPPAVQGTQTWHPRTSACFLPSQASSSAMPAPFSFPLPPSPPHSKKVGSAYTCAQPKFALGDPASYFSHCCFASFLGLLVLHPSLDTALSGISAPQDSLI